MVTAIKVCGPTSTMIMQHAMYFRVMRVVFTTNFHMQVQAGRTAATVHTSGQPTPVRQPKLAKDSITKASTMEDCIM